MSISAQTTVVCDSTAYLPDALVAERGIERISLYVSIDGSQEAESEIADYAGFYERLRASEGGATTSQPSVGYFVSVSSPFLDAGHEVVSAHLRRDSAAAGQARPPHRGGGSVSSTRRSAAGAWGSAWWQPQRRPARMARLSSPGRGACARGA